MATYDDVVTNTLSLLRGLTLDERASIALGRKKEKEVRWTGGRGSQSPHSAQLLSVFAVRMIV